MSPEWIIAVCTVMQKISRLERSLARQTYGTPSWKRVNTMLTMEQNRLDGMVKS